VKNSKIEIDMNIPNIQMVDLKKQYQRLKVDIDESIAAILKDSKFIKGPNTKVFEAELAQYLSCHEVIACANGTDALQIALMALDLKQGDEVIVPAFTYVATAEVIGLLGLTPVMIDVNPDTFNVNKEQIEEAITERTKLIVPVHLFGQCTDMEPVINIAQTHNLALVEDTAQAIGAKYTFSDGTITRAGCIGNIGTTSFFPSKNLGCYGDGGAIFCNDIELSKKLRMIANHGQAQQYHHEIIGINSRLDELQAGILRIKLEQLNDFEFRRNQVADFYDNALSKLDYLQIPQRQANSTHVFHQYTLKVKDGLRNNLKQYLSDKGIPSMVYYPMPLHHQKAYQGIGRSMGDLQVSTQLCKEVLSLPIHTEMDTGQLTYITETIKDFFDGK
jgi:UDP-2-acetamido-2-deoxy-ribo-hexuluronate aminotransferase